MAAVITVPLSQYDTERVEVPHEFIAETKVEKVVEQPIPVEETEPQAAPQPQTTPPSQTASQPTPVVQGGNLSKIVIKL